MTGHDHAGGPGIDLVLTAPVLLAGVAYLAAAAAQRRRGRQPWPVARTAMWTAGTTLVLAALVGPLAAAAHRDLSAHMLAHLLAGMLAPLLLALAAPATLALRTLEVEPARRLSRLLRSRAVAILAHPIVAGGLHLGSLWLLYRGPLLDLAMSGPFWHAVAIGHVVATGYLFTASLVGIDPSPHRRGFPLRLGVLVLATAGHAILAKSVYGAPPPGIPATSARDAALLMYYGGDLVTVALVAVLCAQWYRATRPERTRRRAALT